MDAEIIKQLTTLGVGGAIAALMFVFYRKDVKQFTTLWETTANQLIIVIKDNTASNTRLITMLENQERNSMRKSDLEVLINKITSERKQ